MCSRSPSAMTPGAATHAPVTLDRVAGGCRRHGPAGPGAVACRISYRYPSWTAVPNRCQRPPSRTGHGSFRAAYGPGSMVSPPRRSRDSRLPDATARLAFAARDPHVLRFRVQHVVHELHPLHRGVVHVADLVQPGPEPSARPDALLAQPRLDRAERLVPADRGHGVTHR